ncbi:hypothetical protein [Erwinia tasmaniensis]|uniref:hypothetical protein n=1 Tax=Erwinia tasmaniensis TaxID=338565 RepID=UPI00067441F3|nr:hypothetical protein [Erwinia tasmaniensis]
MLYGLSHAVVQRLLLAVLTLVLNGCSSEQRGEKCIGEVKTLSGQPLGTLQGSVIDRFSSFTVFMPPLKLDSGPLHSNDPQRYVPSAVTRDGWLAQRISSRRFSIINAPGDQAITFLCPVLSASGSDQHRLLSPLR